MHTSVSKLYMKPIRQGNEHVPGEQNQMAQCQNLSCYAAMIVMQYGTKFKLPETNIKEKLLLNSSITIFIFLYTKMHLNTICLWNISLN